MIQYLASHNIDAKPVGDKSDTTSGIESDTSAELTSYETLETAHAMVFRPLFVYRQQQAKKQRLYGRTNSNSRKSGRRS